MVLGVDTNLNATGNLLSHNDTSSDTNTFITKILARDLILFPQDAHSNYMIPKDISTVTWGPEKHWRVLGAIRLLLAKQHPRS